MNTIRVGICGSGGVIPNHVEAIRRVDGVEVVSISSRSLENAQKRAKEFGIPSAYDDHRRLIESTDVDLALIATPNYQHHELVLRAFEAGKHVMVEKPLAVTYQQGEEMVAASKKSGLKLIYAENLPLAPKFAKLVEMTRAKAFGDVYMVRQIERHAGPYSPWFFQKETAGGGVMMDLGCHSISVVHEIFKGQKLKSVKAVQRTFTHTQGDVDDFFLLWMAYASGAMGVVECNWCHQGGMDSVTEVFGKDGNGYADLMKGSGLLSYVKKEKVGGLWNADGWQWPMFDTVYECGYQAQIEAMKETILNDAPPAQSGEDGLEILKIMLDAYDAARQ